jgi:hypothetical protein
VDHYRQANFPDGSNMKDFLIVTVLFGSVAMGAQAQSTDEDTGERFTQNVQHLLDGLKGQDAWGTARCMISPMVNGNVVVTSRDPLFLAGDQIVEVAGEPVDLSSKAPVRGKLVKHPPAGSVSVKLVRHNSEVTVSATCGDPRPFQMLLEEGLGSATHHDYVDCANKLADAQKLVPQPWPVAWALFECRKRSNLLQTTVAQGLYEVDHQVIMESEVIPAQLDKVRAAILKDAQHLENLGATTLGLTLRQELDGALQGSLAANANASNATAKPTTDSAATAAPVISAGHQSNRFVFKGIEVGGIASPAELEKALFVESPIKGIPSVKCGAGSGAMQVCNGWTSAAGISALCNAVITGNGQVIRISLSIPSDFFDTAAQGAIQKYGKPTKTTFSTVQNRMGASFQNTTLVWGDEKGSYILMTKYGSTLDHGILYFGSPEDTALLKQSSAPKSGDF